MHGRTASAAVAAAAALALADGADAATKTVQAGPFGEEAQQQFQAAFGDGNEFYRRVITIHRGDRVRWRINGFHNVAFVPRGETPPPLVIPNPANPVTGVNDAAGAPFWFNGQPNLGFNPLVALPQGGATFDRSELMNSGLPLGGPPQPYTLRFDRKGTFKYLCIVHPGMEGKVRVVGARKAVPSARRDRRSAARQLAATLQRVQRLSTGLGTQGLVKTMQAGNDRRTGATIFRFFPQNPTYKVGDTVTLQMPPQSTEVHTFTFGPTNGRDAYNDQLAASLAGEVLDPRGVYPSDPPPAGIPSYNGANHGNGFYNSGFLDQNASTPLPASTKITFSAPGSFSLICLIHPFMTSTVTVTP